MDVQNKNKSFQGMQVLRQVTVVVFGFVWAVLAYFLMPEGIAERPSSTLSVEEWYRVIASVTTLVVGAISCLLSWRSG